MGVRFTLDDDPFELTPELVRARLQGHQPENIRDYWSRSTAPTGR